MEGLLRIVSRLSRGDVFWGRTLPQQSTGKPVVREIGSGKIKAPFDALRRDSSASSSMFVIVSGLFWEK